MWPGGKICSFKDVTSWWSKISRGNTFGLKRNMYREMGGLANSARTSCLYYIINSGTRYHQERWYIFNQDTVYDQTLFPVIFLMYNRHELF